MGLPFLIDPRQLARALEDVHAIAVAARELPAVERRLTERIESAEGELRRANAHAVELLVAVERIDNVEREVSELVRLAGELRDGLPALDEALRSIRSLQGATATLAAAAEAAAGHGGAARPHRRPAARRPPRLSQGRHDLPVQWWHGCALAHARR